MARNENVHSAKCCSSRYPRGTENIAFSHFQRSTTSLVGTSCCGPVRLQLALDWPMLLKTRRSRDAKKSSRLRFLPRRANEPGAQKRNHRETLALGAQRHTHSILEPGVCPMIGEACTSSAFCLIGKRMTSRVPSFGGSNVQIQMFAPPATARSLTWS